MATISSTLKMFDAMSAPLKSITSSMNLMIQTFEDMQHTADKNTNVGRSLQAAKQQIASAEADIMRATEQATREQERYNRSVEKGSREMGGLTNKVLGFAGAYFSIRGAQSGMKIADDYINSLSRLDLINDGLQTTAELQDRIFAAADRSRGLYTDLANAVSKLGLLAPDAFGSNDEIIAFSELMQKSFAVSGADTTAQQAGMHQLTQAMASGRLQGDEFVSILENAPMLARAIADFTGVGMAGLKEMSSEGLITSDIIKGALFDAADDINEKFNSMPVTFGAIWNQIANQALGSMSPVIERVSEFLNSTQGAELINSIGNAVSFVSAMLGFLIDGFIALIGLVQSGWSIIQPILVAIATVYFVLMIARLWAMVPPLVAQAAAWLAVNWPILVVIAAIAGVLMILNLLGVTSDQVLGAIMGGFAVLGAFIWNTVVGVINAVIQFLWTSFVEPWIGIIEWVLNVFNGGFNSFGDAVKNLLGQIISWFLSLGKIVTKIIDAIFGTDWTSGLENLQDSVLKWGKNEEAITLTREAPMIDSRIGYGDAWNAGYDMGSDFATGITDKLNGFSIDSTLGAMPGDFNSMMGSPEIDEIGKVGEVGKIRDSVDISSEDLKMMRELAEMRNIQNFVTLTPQISVQTGDIRETADTDEIIERITVRLEEEIQSTASGVYA